MPTHGPENSSARRPSPEDVERCHESGMSRNRTAQTLGVSTRQVDNVAAEIGLSWSSEATAEAVAARKERAEMERADLADKFRKLALDSVDKALGEDDSGDRRRFTMSASEAVRSELSIWPTINAEEGTDSAGQAYAALLMAVRNGFRTIEEAPVEEFMDDDGEEVDEPP